MLQFILEDARRKTSCQTEFLTKERAYIHFLAEGRRALAKLLIVPT